MSDESKSPLEVVWENREEVVYPQIFGKLRRGTFVLSGELFTGMFQQPSYDPRWLHYGVIEFAPTQARDSWLYVTSGASNPWEIEPADYASSEYSGFGTELVIESAAQNEWPIVALQRLLAFNILLAHGRYKGSEPLNYGDRVPLRGSIVPGDGSQLVHIVFTKPSHYAPSFTLESGQVDFLHAVGVTQQERDYAKEHGSEELVELLSQHDAYPVTKPERGSVV